MFNLKKQISISDLNKLDQHIINNATEDTAVELEMNKDIYWAEGYLCAITSSPEPMIRMDDWMPYINGDC